MIAYLDNSAGSAARCTCMSTCKTANSCCSNDIQTRIVIAFDCCQAARKAQAADDDDADFAAALVTADAARPPFSRPPAGWRMLRGRDRDQHPAALPGPRPVPRAGLRPRPGRDRSRYAPTP